MTDFSIVFSHELSRIILCSSQVSLGVSFQSFFAGDVLRNFPSIISQSWNSWETHLTVKIGTNYVCQSNLTNKQILLWIFCVNRGCKWKFRRPRNIRYYCFPIFYRWCHKTLKSSVKPFAISHAKRQNIWFLRVARKSLFELQIQNTKNFFLLN